MKKIIFLFCLTFLGIQLFAQTEKLAADQLEVSETHAILLGKTIAVKDIVPSNTNYSIKKGNAKKNKAVPENFIGRRGYSKAIIPELEHLGEDPLLVLPKAGMHKSIDARVNMNGVGNFGSPHDPTGDIGTNYYIQAVNGTFVGVYDKTGERYNSST